MKTQTLRLLILILSAVLIVALTFAAQISKQEPTQPPQLQSPPSSTPSSQANVPPPVDTIYPLVFCAGAANDRSAHHALR